MIEEVDVGEDGGANVSDRIRAFIRDSFFVEDVSEEESFLQSGIIDSTAMLELVGFLEQEFDIEILDEELVPENLDSLARAAAFVLRKRDRPAA